MDYGLETLQNANVLIKEKHYAILKAVAIGSKDVLAVLSTV